MDSRAAVKKSKFVRQTSFFGGTFTNVGRFNKEATKTVWLIGRFPSHQGLEYNALKHKNIVIT